MSEEEKEPQITKEIKTASCRNCKNEIETKQRRCCYCGILNPTVTLKEICVTIAGILIIMGIYTYILVVY